MTADHERARSVNARLPVAAPLPQPWRGYGAIAQVVFFLLTAVGIAAFYFLTRAEVLTAVGCIALAEVLIRVRKWFGTGVEAALWIGGLLAALEALPDSGRPESDLLIAAAFAIAGFRLRNPLFGGVAAYFVTRYLEVIADLGTLAAVVFAAAALFALYKEWRRPSTEWLFIVVAVALPLGGWFHADRKWALVTIALYASFSAIAFGSAIVKRHHAMFAAAASAAVVAVAVLADVLNLKPAPVLAASGAALLLVSWMTARRLRGNTSGFVVTPAKLTAFDDELQSLGTAAIAVPASAGNPPEERPRDGGGFGGAGATGDL